MFNNLQKFLARLTNRKLNSKPQTRKTAFTSAPIKAETPAPIKKTPLFPESFPEKTCKHCGKTFIPNFPSRKYCSKECAKAVHRKQIAELEKKRRAELKAIQPPKIFEKTCKHCGKTFTTQNPHKLYCSEKCRSQKRFLEKKADEPKKTCVVCGKTLDKGQLKYCSDCTPYKKHDPLKKTCPVCGKSFVTTRKKAKYCSQTCSDEARLKRDKERYYADKKVKVEVEQTCQNCGKKFIASSTRQIFCSRSCKEEYDRLIYSSKPKVSKTAFSSSKKPKSGKTIEQWTHEAIQCGMSYGLYRAAINAGKTFDELKLPDPAPVEEKILFECKI